MLFPLYVFSHLAGAVAQRLHLCLNGFLVLLVTSIIDPDYPLRAVGEKLVALLPDLLDELFLPVDDHTLVSLMVLPDVLQSVAFRHRRPHPVTRNTSEYW